MTVKWISCAEAAKLLDGSEESVKVMVNRGIIRGQLQETELVVDKDYLVGWLKHRDKPRVEIAEIYTGIANALENHYRTTYAKEQAQHASSRGSLYDELISISVNLSV
jgi:hypothetical protein